MILKQTTYFEFTDIGQSIRQLRKEKGFSIAHISKETGLSPSAISRWERGIRVPTVKAYIDIMNVLGVRLEIVTE